jgi:hypothetical protein
MMNKLIGLVIGLAVPASLALACVDGEPGIFPPNSMNIPAKPYKTIQENMFNEVITRAEKFYAPIFAADGLTFQVNRLWSDGTVNASAIQKGKIAEVNMYGGLARHPLVTADAFALVLCHEIGHHLGGAPKYKRFFTTTWASDEGQSDYFATLKCSREMFKNDDNQAIMSKVAVPALVTEKCQKTFDSSGDIALCQRSAMAGAALANTLGSLNNLPEAKFDSPDTSKVSKTNHAHPAAQCRLDTYFAGAICEVAKETSLSDTDETVGTCNIQKNFETGVRPLCWFAPSVGGTSDGGSWPSE